jgi:hypothetical protein
MKSKRGGYRPNSGAKLKYGEETTTIAVRVPKSKAKEIKQVIKTELLKYRV